MEAHDKRNLDEATLNEPKGMQAIVSFRLVYGEVRVGFSLVFRCPISPITVIVVYICCTLPRHS
jgi:hypothetical protein